MKHADNRRALVERLTALLESLDKLPITFRDYQCETLRATRSWLEDLSGTRRGHVEHATGLGKTEIFSAIAGFCTSLRVLVVVPTKVLIEQTAKKTVRYTGGVLGHLSSLDVVRDDDERVIAVRGYEFSNIVFTTDETLMSNPRRIANEFDPNLIIFDENHWGYTERIVAALNLFPEAVIIGYSATPDYLTMTARPNYVPVTLDNGQVLYAPPDRLAKNQFGTLLDRRTVPWGIREGWLAPMAWGQIDFDMSLDPIPLYEGEGGLDYQDHVLGRFMGQHWSQMALTIGRMYLEGRYNLPDRQVFAVCPSVNAAQELAQAMETIGIPSACITGNTTTKDRINILRAYARREKRLLTSVMVLREGWDANPEVCLMLRPTKSRVLYVQPMGRALRPELDGTEKVSLVLDGHYRNTRFRPLVAPDLFGPVGQEVTMGDMLLRTRPGASGPAKYVERSPYITNGVKYSVKQIMVDRFAGKDGMIEADGELWATERALPMVKMEIPYLHILANDKRVRTRIGKTYTGQEATFYAFADVVREMEKRRI